MSAYLKFFELKQSPFDGKAQTQVVLGTKALREAFATIQTGLEEGAARICVGGGPGLGKTSLARALPKLLGNEARVAVVLDAGVSWGSQRASLARQWGLEGPGLARASLLQASQSHRLVVVIDQAEKASEEFLDHLDVVLSYRTESDEPVVQAVLLARLTGGDSAEPPPLVWWLDRIQTLQLEFAPLPREGVESYIQKHLKRAGWRGEHLFSEEAALAIHGYTAGIPGEVSRLCERLLASAAQRDIRSIHAEFVHDFCDPPDGRDPNWGLEDEFEELVLEEEFAGAESHVGEDATEELLDEDELQQTDAASSPSLSDTLEHFDAAHPSSTEGALDQSGLDQSGLDEDDPGASASHVADDSETYGWPRDDDASSHDDAQDLPCGTTPDDFFDGPATSEELRAIRGSFLARNILPVAATAAAVLLVGVGLALFGSDDPAPGSDIEPTAAPGELAGGTLAEPGEAAGLPTVLGRVRGPVTPEMAAQEAKADSAGAEPVVAPAAPPTEEPRRVADRAPTPDRVDVPADWSDPEFLSKTGGRLERMEEPASETTQNLAPAAIPPDAAADRKSRERFW